MDQIERDAAPAPGMAERLLFALFLFVGLVVIWANVFHSYKMDFLSYWAAARLTLEGHAAAAYDIARHQAVIHEAVPITSLLPFAYPPPFLILLAPLGLLSYPLAAALWIGFGLALFILAMGRLFPACTRLAVAFPPVLPNLILGQSGLLTGGLFAAALATLARCPFLGGALFGLLVLKPQLGLMIPLALAAGGQWRAVAGAAAAAIGALGLAWLVFGSEAYAGMASLAPLFSRIAAEGLTGWHKMASVYAALRLAGLG